MIITIDGPSGTGKSTVAKGVAKRLGFTFFDTGAMYRSFAWLVLKEGVDPSDEHGVIGILPRFHYEIRTASPNEKRYFVEGQEVTDAIRSQAISMAASQIAVYPAVRHEMVLVQRKYGHAVDAVFEGRDMGTVVFPDADLKIFLTAKSSVRAERRYRELIAKFPDLEMTQEEIQKEIEERDRNDSTRSVSPLKQASDAILIDTSNLTAQEVIEQIVKRKPKRKFPRMRFFYWVCYVLVRAYFKLFFRLRIHGMDHFRPGGAVIVANHTSFYDPPLLYICCPEEVHSLARGSLFDIPVLGFIMRCLNSHPIARGAADAVAFRMMIDLLTQERKLILFPEGNRSFDGDLQPIERGLAFLVQKARCRIIPAYIQGAFEAWPRTKKFPKPYGKMTVVFGSPIEWDDHLDKKAAQARITSMTEASFRNLKSWLENGAQGNPP